MKPLEFTKNISVMSLYICLYIRRAYIKSFLLPDNFDITFYHFFAKFYLYISGRFKRNIGPDGPELICHILQINFCTRSVEILCVCVYVFISLNQNEAQLSKYDNNTI